MYDLPQENSLVVSNKYTKILLGVFVFLAFIIGLGVGLTSSSLITSVSQIPDSSQQNVNTQDLSLLRRVENYVIDSFFGEVITLNQVQHELARAFINLLDDPNSYYLNPEEAEKYLASFSQDFEGIGVILRESESDGVVYIAGIIEGGPASREPKIEIKSEILKVQEEAATGLTVQQVASLIRGPAKSSVDITLKSPTGEIYSVTIVREKILIPKITFNQYPNLTYIRIIDFIDTSVGKYNSEWNNILSKIIELDNKNIILDLRSNSGGYVESAIHLANSFLQTGDIILKEIGSKGQINREVRASRDGELSKFKIFIIIDQNTASAAEILTLALKENNASNIVIIGDPSFGKGTEQRMIPNFSGGGGLLNITFQKWTAPSGRVVTPEDPIMPDIGVQDISTMELEKLIEFVQNLISDSRI